MKSYAEMVAEAKTKIREVTPAEAMSDASSGIVYLDCREANEYNLGHIPGATFIPRGQIEQKVESLVPRDSKVVVYCASGNRSALVADTMQEMGYADVASMSGGIRGWADAGGEIE
jgi:rhodanese-related sulfurtransferase